MLYGLEIALVAATDRIEDLVQCVRRVFKGYPGPAEFLVQLQALAHEMENPPIEGLDVASVLVQQRGMAGVDVLMSGH